MTNNAAKLLTQQKILKAFDKSEKKTISEICHIAGVKTRNFYYHLERDEKFRQSFHKKQQDHINKQLSEI